MSTLASPQTRVLEPGLVHISRALTQAEQEWLAGVALEDGERRGGFYEDGKLNSTRSRGRIYDTLERFPKGTQDFCMKQVAHACGADPSMPAMVPTHLLLLKYNTEKGVGFHRDNGENDGAGDFPVVSLSIGNSATFTLKHERNGPETQILLESGDAVLFGGPCRQMLHAVTEVHVGTAPFWLPAPFQNARLNFTFRHAPEIRGRERDFALFMPGAKPLGHNRFRTALESGIAQTIPCPPTAWGDLRRLCPCDGKPYTQAQFEERHGCAWKEIWEAAQAGPAAGAEGAREDAERMISSMSASDLTGVAICASAETGSGDCRPKRRWKLKA